MLQKIDQKIQESFNKGDIDEGLSSNTEGCKAGTILFATEVTQTRCSGETCNIRMQDTYVKDIRVC